MEPSNLASPFLTIDELAVRWRCSTDYLYHNVKSSGLTYMKRGNAYLFELDDVVAFEKANKRSATV